MAAQNLNSNLTIDELLGATYKGYFDLNLDEFPMVYGAIEPGKYSNIYTRYFTYGADEDKPTEWVLTPGMYKGIPLSEEESERMVKKGMHFGVYKSKEQMEAVDKLIHQHFEEQSIIPQDSVRNVPLEKRKFNYKEWKEKYDRTGGSKRKDIESGKKPEKKAPAKFGDFGSILEDVALPDRQVFSESRVLNKAGIRNFRDLEKSDLTPSQKLFVIKEASRRG